MLKDKIKKCLDEGKRGGERHQGLIKIKPNSDRANEHVRKALRNFEAITDFRNTGHSDWSASAAFYTLYHGLLAILAKKGYESRNQSCTFAMIESLLEEKKLKELTIKDVREIFDKDITENLEHSTTFLDMRERMQYSILTQLQEEEFKMLKERARLLLGKIRLELEN
ncbi:MAG TPA: HEPN domain-containing protein [Candidatus Nanoarchaeia archaeon]|nr:HEPN domain-containing protein [Candidatus Nanoarchaeia archaeon]